MGEGLLQASLLWRAEWSPRPHRRKGFLPSCVNPHGHGLAVCELWRVRRSCVALVRTPGMGLRPEAHPVGRRTTLWARGPWPGWAGFGHSSGWRPGVGPRKTGALPPGSRGSAGGCEPSCRQSQVPEARLGLRADGLLGPVGALGCPGVLHRFSGDDMGWAAQAMKAGLQARLLESGGQALGTFMPSAPRRDGVVLAEQEVDSTGPSGTVWVETGAAGRPGPGGLCSPAAPPARICPRPLGPSAHSSRARACPS